MLTLTRTVDQNWLEGTLDDMTGMFPVNFVKVRLTGQPSFNLLVSTSAPPPPPPPPAAATTAAAAAAPPPPPLCSSLPGTDLR